MDWLKQNRMHLVILGLLQGLIFSFIWRTFDLDGDVGMPIRIAVDLLVAIALLIYASEGVAGLPQRSRVVIIATLTLLALLLQEYAFWIFADTTWGSWFPQAVLPTLILVFIAVHLLMHWRVLNPAHHAYADLFHTTWRNAILCGLGVGLTVLFWGVLVAGAQLFKLIGITALADLIEKSWFAIPATTTVFGMVVALGLLREEMIVSLRRLLLGLLRWFLPLVLLMAAVWSLALPFTGVEELFKTRSAAWTMLVTVALGVLFANAAFQDGRGGEQYPRWLGTVLSWLWLALIPVAVIAIWALTLRVGQYDWTSARAWGFFVALLALGYAVGYALSVLRGNGATWMNAVARTNRVMAVLTCIGILALLSPVLDTQRLEAARQEARARQAQVPVDAKRVDARWPDLGFVSQTGRWGLQAGDRMMTADTKFVDANTTKVMRELIAAELVQAKANSRPRPPRGENHERRITASNAAAENPQIMAYLQQHAKNECWENECRVYWYDLDGDGRSEALLFQQSDARSAIVYGWENGKLARLGSLGTRDHLQGNAPPLLPLLESGKAESVPARWRRIQVGGREFGLE